MSLRGFIIDVRTVHESNLEVEVDCSHIDWEEYKAFVEELEDLLGVIDEEHSVKSWLVKGRSLRARYRRVSAEDRRRRLRFSPFPSKFSNLLKNTRAYVYGLVAENCLVLEQVGRRKVYLLPKHLAPFFVEAVDRINSEVIKPLREEVEEFRRSDEYLKIEQCLYSHKVNPAVLKTAVFQIGEYVVDVLPVDFGYSVDADEVYAKMKRAKAVKGLEILKRQIEKRLREYAFGAVSDLIKRVVEMAEGLERGAKIRNAAEKVEKLIEISDSLDLKEISEGVLKPLKRICEARSRKRKRLSEKLFGKPSLSEGVKEVLKTLHLEERREK